MKKVLGRFARSAIHNVEKELLCPAPEVDDLTAEELAALHVFKHEVLSAGYRLYLHVPQECADPILRKYFRLPSDDDGSAK